MLALIFDTECIGLPKNYEAKINDLDNWPRVLQLGWEVVEIETERVLKKACYLIKPDGWEIPSPKMYKLLGYSDKESLKKASFWVNHNFTQEENNMLGLPIEEVLIEFIADHDKCNHIVAHNMGFDHPVLGAEMVRAKLRAGKVLNKICTMRKGEYIVRIPGKFKGCFSRPKLHQLYFHFTKRKFEGAHRADSDVEACRICFLEMYKRKLITL